MAKKAAAKPKTPKKAKQAKAPKPKAKAAPPRVLAKNFNAIDPEEKRLFLDQLKIIREKRALATKFAGQLRKAYGEAKKLGFIKEDFNDAIAMEQPETEKVRKAEIARTLKVARYMGADMGMKYDLFIEDERVAATDRAYEEGQTASMKNEAAKPQYDPSTDQYRSYMKGFHDHQGKLAAGIKKVSTEKAAVAKEDGEGDAEEQSQIDMPPPENSPAAKKAAEDAITSGVPTTRSEFMKRQADLETGGKPN